MSKTLTAAQRRELANYRQSSLDVVIKTLKAAQEIGGKMSISNTKMPGSTFPTSTTKCVTGLKLAEIPNSVCSECYATRLEKLRPNVAKGWLNNSIKTMRTLATDPGQWIAASVYQINHFYKRTGQYYHRWFDSGDLENETELHAIAQVAVATPKFNHWLPTKEIKLLRAYLKRNTLPDNLVARASSPMIDQKPLSGFRNTSTVHRDNDPVGHSCPAKYQGHSCGKCRACWDPSVANVSYPKH